MRINSKMNYKTDIANIRGTLAKPHMNFETLLQHLHLDLDEIFGESKKIDLDQIDKKSVDKTDFEIKESANGFDVSFTDSVGKIFLAFFKTIKASESWLDMMMGESTFVSDSSLSEYNSKVNGRHFY